MTIPDRELVATIRFAMKATKEVELYDSRSKEKAVEKLGVELGHELASNLVLGEATSIYTGLANFWNESGLGTMVSIQADPRMIRLSNCCDCTISRLGDSPTPCTFKRSLLKTVLQDSVRRTVHVAELECCKNGGTGCVFLVK